MLLQQIHSPITDKPLLSEEEAKAADQRFAEGIEPDNIPVPTENAGFFDGIGEAAWKGIASGLLKSGSVYSTMIGASGLPESAEGMYMAETGQEALVDSDTVRDRLQNDAISMRERARKDYGVNPETMGLAAQIVYGLSEMLPKAMAYTMAAGPTGGAIAFGFDYGASRAQELMDKGVDTKTAVAAGIWTGAAGALGVKIPATFGSSRLASAAIGAVANAGLTAAEEAGVQFALESQNYDQLAEQYGLNFVDIAASAFFGGVMGGVLYRPRTTTTLERTITSETRAKIEDDIFNKLMATGRFNEEQARVQAKIQFGGIETMADRAGVDVEKIAPTITFSEDFSNQFAQRAWHGTAHIFETFSTEKIGSGEGAQAHGWGLYFQRQKSSPVFELKGSEIAPLDASLDNLRVSAKDWYDANLRGLEVTNAQSGLKVEFVGSRKAIATSANPDKLRLFPAIKAVIINGHMSDLIPVDPNRAKAQNIRGYRWITAAVKLGDNVVDVGVTLREDNNGRLYYNHNILKDETPPNSEFKPLTKQALEQRGNNEDSPSTNNDRVNLFIRQSNDNVEIRGSYDPARNDIRLTQNADISTYSHEMGHWYLSNIFELSKVAGDNTTLREDAQALLKEFGVKSIEDWEALGVDGQRKFHEQFASWVEVYLAEGKAPKPALQRVFERFAQWLVDLYRELGGVREAVGGRYEAEFGEQLPAVSPEVKKVLDRLFVKDNEMRKARSNVTKEQVASARVVQSKRSLDKKLQDIMKMRTAEEKAQAIKELGISLDGVNRATDQINSANTVNLNNLAEQVSIDPEKMKTARGNFAKAYMIGDKGKAVVLQNRDRSSKVSTGQISSIAGNLQYGLVSISRSYNGAPIFSFGYLPPDAQLGNNDFIFETNGRRIPFTYAVVEAADVETSNAVSGASNANYGNQERMNAVVGNGRMTAIREAYSKGTADNYRREFTADTDQHGIDAAVIEGMKQPVLVRIINPEDVDDGLINRSNESQVLKRNSVEVAFEDAGRIRARASVYEFDERGEPTRDTVVQFLQDIGDIQALGDMVTSDGRPTLDATRRIHNAVFYVAYESPELSQLYSMEADPGIKRILNAMAIIAPKIIQLKDVAPHLDFSTNMVEAANRILAARRAAENGVDLINQGALDGMENPLTQQFIDLFNQNMNSAAGIVDVLRPLSDWARNAIDATDGGMFGEDFAVNVDLADLAQQFVDIQNIERNVRGLDPLPDIDKPALRRLIEQTRQTTDEVNAQLDALAARDAEDVAQAQAQQTVDLARSAEVLNPETSGSARLAFAVEQNPDQMFSILDDNGQVVRGTADELFAAIDEEVRQADTEAAATGRAVECILRNNGI